MSSQEHATENVGRKVLSSIGVMMLGKVAIGGLRFITRVVLARLLEPAGLGVFGILTSSVSLCVVLGNAGTQNSHIHDLGKKRSTPGGDVGFSIIYSLSAGTLGILVFYMAYHFFLYEWYFARYFIEKYPLVVRIFLVFPASLLWLHLSSILLGNRQFRMANVFILLNATVFLIGLLFFDVVIRNALDSAVMAWMTATVVSASLLLIYCMIRFRSTLALSLSNLGHKLTYGGLAMVSGLSETVTLMAPVFVAGYFVEPREVGLLFLALSLARIIEQIAIVLNSVLFPFNSSLGKDQAVHLTSNSFRIFFNMSLVGLALSWPIAIYGVPLIFGSEYADAGILLIVMMPGIVALSLVRILHAFFLGQSKPRTTITPYLVILISILVLEILLVPNFGVIGAAIGITVAYLIGLGIITMQFLSFSQSSFGRLYRLSFSDLNAIRKS